MVMTECYDDEKERKRHSSAMQALARDLGISTNEVVSVYERTLTELKAHARIKDFLSILASRQVRDLLRRERVA